MIEINYQGRGTGKTKAIIDGMSKDSNSICIIPVSNFKQLYPKEWRNRLYSGYDVDKLFYDLSSLRDVSTVFIDEGFSLAPHKAAEMYYLLGKLNYNVVVYGS